ncbi:hormonally up-regulated neu tumor-associated kinase homolog A-like [Spea bombifrons]|uniref:hormonally up-regulated neu tumor-associated kinase homolog A-like n=1 Tax=Spea bombifrons TaxID=233779 RepID=UPI00234A37B8|nr:hormonally up-regulated neu tumor-associated kinase homolog A-like [Spea bombifrons]
MPAAINPGLDNTKPDRIFPEWVKQNKEMQGLTCFKKMSRESLKNFPHTKRVGHYLVGKMINKGSFAKVMEGLHIPTGQKVAMKVICKKKAKQDSYVLKNMKREPQIHQMIKHPNIVQLYDTLETENSYYMVMELCLGGDLMDRICDKKKLEETDVRKYARQLMSAVEHLHRHGIVHRDLKIENFLLDENNNIKIVDFGLSNTIRFEGLSQELLSTQCGSPAYAAPELLANKKYGPKVDVWSIGVSMFAMLTGTLPFTVEPFNIKQLHQKMINGEISPIPPDVSAGAVQFIHTLLEADPSRRPTVKEAMEDKWLNEGFTRKPLISVSYKNRLQPDELNTLVLNYMTETMDLDISEIVNTLADNRPSPIMASYCLLLKKLQMHQKEHTIIKIEAAIKKSNNVHTMPSKDETQNTAQSENERKDAKTDKRPISHEPIQEDEIAITLDNQENVFEGSQFAGREMVYLKPPNSSKQETLDVNIKHCSLDVNDLKSNQESNTSNPDKKREYFPRKPQQPDMQKRQPPQSYKMGSSNTGKKELKHINRLSCESPPSQKQFTRFRDLLKSVDNNIPPAYSQQKDKECLNIVTIETLHHSPLPRVRQPALRNPITKHISWVVPHHVKTGSPPFVFNGSRPPVFPMSRQQTIMDD